MPPPRDDGALSADGTGPPRWTRWLLPLFVIVTLASWRLFSSSGPMEGIEPIPYSTFVDYVQKDRVESIQMSGLEVTGTLRDQGFVGEARVGRFVTRLPEGEGLAFLADLQSHHAEITVLNPEGSAVWGVVGAMAPWLVVMGVWFWLSRRSQRMMTGGGGPLAEMFKGHAKRFEAEKSVAVRFDDVAGLKGAKGDLQEVIGFLTRPEHFRRLGAKVPRGMLLVGPPGIGKTLLARAVAGEAGVPYFSINGSEFIELFVGVGASRVRELFSAAKKLAPAIVFIDEIDAVGRSRGAGLGGGNDEREQTLNQLLAEMDGFSDRENVVVLAATNRPDVLDPALLRPGRFDRRVFLDRPDRAARLSILGVHTKGKPVADDVSLETLAADSPGLSGADLANLVNEAALAATQRDAVGIEAQDFRHAYDKILLGGPSETLMTSDEKRRVVLHEAGHAVAAKFTPYAAPLRRVSVIPRGMTLGATQQVPDEDQHLATRRELGARLTVLLGGFAAEKAITKDLSTGAANDLERATDLAHKMVAHYGMSEGIGPMYHELRTEHPFLGQRLGTDARVSDATIRQIELEVRQLLIGAAESAATIITEHRPAFDRLVRVLLEEETVEEVRLHAVLDGPRSVASRPASGASEA